MISASKLFFSVTPTRSIHERTTRLPSCNLLAVWGTDGWSLLLSFAQKDFNWPGIITGHFSFHSLFLLFWSHLVCCKTSPRSWKSTFSRDCFIHGCTHVWTPSIPSLCNSLRKWCSGSPDLACNPSPSLFCLFDIELKSNYAIHGFSEGRECLELFQIPKIWEVFRSMSIPSGSNHFLSHTFPPLCPLISTPRLETFGWLKHVKLNHWKGQREIKAPSCSERSSTSVYSSWFISVCWGWHWTWTARKDCSFYGTFATWRTFAWGGRYGETVRQE